MAAAFLLGSFNRWIRAGLVSLSFWIIGAISPRSCRSR
jgi:hypothetical protein